MSTSLAGLEAYSAPNRVLRLERWLPLRECKQEIILRDRPPLLQRGTGRLVHDLSDFRWRIAVGALPNVEKVQTCCRPIGKISAKQLNPRLDIGRAHEEMLVKSSGSHNSRAEVILPSGDRVVTLGVNWYLNRWMKLQLNAIHEELQDPGRTPLVNGDTSFWSTVFRAQFAM